MPRQTLEYYRLRRVFSPKDLEHNDIDDLIELFRENTLHFWMQNKSTIIPKDCDAYNLLWNYVIEKHPTIYGAQQVTFFQNEAEKIRYSKTKYRE